MKKQQKERGIKEVKGGGKEGLVRQLSASFPSPKPNPNPFPGGHHQEKKENSSSLTLSVSLLFPSQKATTRGRPHSPPFPPKPSPQIPILSIFFLLKTAYWE